METRTKRMRKNKIANKRKVSRNRIQYKNADKWPNLELVKEFHELIDDKEIYKP
jgi:hypothetical protein